MQFTTSAIRLSDNVSSWKELPQYIPVAVKNMFHNQVSGDLYMLSGAAEVTVPVTAMVHPKDAGTPTKFIRVFGEDVITVRAYPYRVELPTDAAVFSLGCQLSRYVWQPGVGAAYLFVSEVIYFGGANYVYAAITAIR